MSSAKVEVARPGGQKKAISLERAVGEPTLLELLEQNGFPLNTRCGGRGICNGCQVELHAGDEALLLKSCQQKLKDLPPSIDRITIPQNSWRDHSLHGVSAFEIHGKGTLATGKSGFGIALDIGTTTVAGALWNLENGHCMAHSSMANSQARFGDNVLSRISYALDNPGGEKDLQEVLIRKCVNPLISKLCSISGLGNGEITTSCVSGNPVMLHTFAGERLDGFSAYPFKPVFLGERVANGGNSGIQLQCDIRLLPGLGPFVGSDIVAGALASGVLEREGPVLLIDFGTNGEILLKHNSGYMATATAAGPAFEGGRLNCGSVARAGAISSLSRNSGQWEWQLSGTKSGVPGGISGAAYVDFMAIGKKTGLLDMFGRIDRAHPDASERINDEDSDWCVSLNDDVYISESDVAELLQAKAAIQGGVATLLELADITASDLKSVIVAGGFGYHLNPGNAVSTGLLPNVPVERIEMVGNASLGGASLLLSPSSNGALGELLDNCKVIELNQAESFEDHFTDALILEESDSC